MKMHLIIAKQIDVHEIRGIGSMDEGGNGAMLFSVP
jgi:hypothetical protein